MDKEQLDKEIEKFIRSITDPYFEKLNKRLENDWNRSVSKYLKKD